MKTALRLLIFSLLALIAAPVTPGAEVSLLTCMPGSEIYELEGHSAIRVRFDDGRDITVNWGVFDFNSPNFVYRFVKGETDYLAAECPTRFFLDEYRRRGRAVVEQVLDLTPEQTRRLITLIGVNLQPQNRVYRYNYVLDNCATRPLAIIESAVGDTLRLSPSGLSESEGSTFRNVMRKYHTNYPWYQFGIDTALGSGIDTPLSPRMHSFAPVLLREMMDGATFADGTPVVRATRYAVGSPSTPSAVLGATPSYLTPLFWGWVVFALALWASVEQWRGRQLPAKWFDTLYFGLAGIEGCVLTFLIFVSVHYATSPNWLYLWLNPLCLIGAVAPWFVGLKSGRRLEICYQFVNFALLIALCVTALRGTQSLNPSFVPLIAASALRALVNIIKLRQTPHNK